MVRCAGWPENEIFAVEEAEEIFRYSNKRIPPPDDDILPIFYHVIKGDGGSNNVISLFAAYLCSVLMEHRVYIILMACLHLYNLCKTLSFIWSKCSRPALRALRCNKKTDASIQWLLQTYKSKYRSQGGAKM